MFDSLPFSFSLSSTLPLPADYVWENVANLEGVNRELLPWVRLTVPRSARGLIISDAEVGVPLFDSWLLVGAILPVDRHRFCFEEVREGYFLEASSSWLHSSWRHERSVVSRDGGCLLTDRVGLQPRVALFGGIFARVVRATFTHRHRRLARWAASDHR